MKILNKNLFIASSQIYKDPELNQPNSGYIKAQAAGFTLLKTSGKTDSSTGFFAGVFYHKIK